MPLDPRAKRFLDMAAAGAKLGRRPTISERRLALVKLMQFAAADVTAEPGTDGMLPGPASAIPYRLYAPPNATPEPCPGFVFFHGGGMVAGSIETHDVICRALAAESGCRLISVGYRLAPEHKFPAAIEDAIAAVRWVSGHGATLGIDTNRLVIGGDSAGATLAAVVCQEVVHSGGPPIILQCLICPVLEAAGARESRRAFADGYLIDRLTLESDLAAYLTDSAESADPRVSPLCAPDFAGLPPAIVHTAEFDPLRDEGNAYAERMQAAGISVRRVCHPGMIHNFHALGTVLPQGRQVLKMLGSQIRAVAGS